MSFSLDRSKTASPEIPQREECRLLMRAVPDPIFKFSLPWKVCPKPLAGSTLAECSALSCRVVSVRSVGDGKLEARKVARKMRR